jgi:putative transposase
MCICFRERRVYPSDVTDAEWAILEPLIPPVKPGGRPEEIERREIESAHFVCAAQWVSLAHAAP